MIHFTKNFILSPPYVGPSDQTVEMQTTDMEEFADVPNYWMTTCDPSLKPVVGQRFERYKEAKDTDLMESGAPTHPKR
nr:hypothetical protein Iba_chr09bCG11450 [Ipomoea batatas]